MLAAAWMLDQLRWENREATWRATRDEIRTAILDGAWSESAGAYTQYLIYRYRGGDGFDVPEGTFLLCTSGWPRRWP